MKHAIKFNFQNGWTASIARDTDTTCWNIMGWQTRHDDPPWERLKFYVWKDDQTDVRLRTIDELIARLVEITTAAPPP